MLDLKLLAHINNDAHLIGTQKLEGELFSNTIRYFKNFVTLAREDKTDFPANLMSEKIDPLCEKLERMAQKESDHEALIRQLQPLSQDEREQAYRDNVRSWAKEITELKGSQPENGVFIAGGYQGLQGGHAMIYEFKKDKEGNLYFLVHNSGAGIHYHQQREAPDKIRYQPVKAFKIPRNEINEKDLNQFLVALMKARTDCLLDATKENVESNYDEEKLYRYVIPKIVMMDAEEIKPEDIPDFSLKSIETMGQRSGTCAEKVIHQLLKSTLEKNNQKLLIFCLKKHSIEQYMNEHSDGLTFKEAHELNLAVENLSRGLEKQFEEAEALYPAELIKETQALIQKVKKETSKVIPKHKNQVNQISELQPFPKPSSVEARIEEHSPYFEPDPKRTDDTIKDDDTVDRLVKKFSLEAFELFVHQDEDIDDPAYHTLRIEELLRRLPLAQDHYTDLATPEKFDRFCKLSEELLKKYEKNHNRLTGSSLGPKGYMSIASLMFVMKLASQNPGATLLSKSLLPYMNRKFQYLLNDIQYNPYLMTRDPNWDKRLKELNEAIKRIPPESHSAALAIEEAKNFIENHPNREAFEAELDRVFEACKNDPKKIEDVNLPNQPSLQSFLEHLKAQNLTRVYALVRLHEDIDKSQFPEASQAVRSSLGVDSMYANLLRTLSITRLDLIEFEYPSYYVNYFMVNENGDIVYCFGADNDKQIQFYSPPSDLQAWFQQAENQNINNALSASALSPPVAKGIIRRFKLNRSWKYPNDNADSNHIYCTQEGIGFENEKNQGDKVRTSKSLTEKMFWQLRTQPELQLTLTVDYLKENLHFLKEHDWQIYFQHNLFQPGLLDKALTVESEGVLNLFQLLEDSLKYYSLESGDNLEVLNFIFQQHFFISQYILKGNYSHGREKAQAFINVALEQLDEVVSQYSQHDKVSKFYKTQLMVQTLSHEVQNEQSEADVRRLFDDYMNYHLYNTDEAYSPDELNMETEVLANARDILKANKHLIPQCIKGWCDSLPDIRDRMVEGSDIREDYPNYYVVNDSGATLFKINLREGALWEGNQRYSIVPSGLVTNKAYRKFIGESRQLGFVKKVQDEFGHLINQYQVKAPDKKDYLFIDAPKSPKAFKVYTKKDPLGQKSLHELQCLTSHKERTVLRNGKSIQEHAYESSHLGITSSTVDLPASFFGSSVLFWKSTTDASALIERANKSYYISEQRDVYELDNNGEKTGYQLIHPRKGKKAESEKSDEKDFFPLSSIFSHFEDDEFIEIYNNPVNEFDYKVYLPRVQLEFKLKRNNENQQLELVLANDPDWIVPNQVELPWAHMPHVLALQNKINKQMKYLVPDKEFVLDDRFYHGKSGVTEHEHVYKATRLDTSNKTKDILISPLGQPSRTDYNTVGHDRYYEFELNPLSNRMKVNTPVEGLALAYYSLGGFEPSEAFQYLQEVIELGGLQGTHEELIMIEKLFQALPRMFFSEIMAISDAEIKNPSYYAVKAQLASLLMPFAKGDKTFTINDFVGELKDDTDKSLYSLASRLRDFNDGYMVQIEDLMKDYHSTRNNIPNELQLSPEQEYTILNQLFYDKKSIKGPLGVRYRELRAQYLGKEFGFVEQADKALGYEARADNLKRRLKKHKDVILAKGELDKSKITVPTPQTFNLNSSKIESRSEFYKHLLTKDNQALPSFGMDQTLFCQNFLYYLELALSDTDSPERHHLIQYCDRITRAHAKLLNDVMHKPPEKKPRPPEVDIMLTVILNKVIKQKDAFNKQLFYKSFQREPEKIESFISNLYGWASNQELNVTLEEVKVYTEHYSFDVSKAVEKVQPVQAVTAGKFQYSSLGLNQLIKDANLSEFQKDYTEYRDKANQEQSKYIDDHYPENEPFENSRFKIKEIDRYIGEQKNSAQKRLTTIGIDHLKDKDRLNDIQDILSSQYIPQVMETVRSLEDLVLDLANEGPEDERSALKHHLQLAGKKRKPLTMPDLMKLYVLEDLNQYTEATGLSEEKAKQLHQHLADYVQLKILEKSYSNASQLLRDCENHDVESKVFKDKIAKLGQILMAENLADFSNEAAIQYFQMAEGITLFDSQKFYLDKLLKRDESTGKFNSEVIQLIMGGGKSTVLSPLSALLKANGHNLAVIQVKQALFNTNLEDLNKTSLRLFGQKAIPFQFDRNSPSSSDDLKQIYDKFHKAMVDRNYIVTTGNALQSLELKYIELLLEPSAFNDQQEWARQIKWLEKTVNLLRTQTDRLIDEIHDENDPRSVLNYTLGEPRSLLEADIDLQLDLFQFFNQVDLTSLNIPHLQSFLDIVKNNKIIQNDADWDKALALLAQSLVTDAQSPLAEAVAQLDLNETQRDSLKDYLLNQPGASIPNSGALDKRQMDVTAFLKHQISTVLPFTLKRNLYEHYGPSRSDNKDALTKAVPIPYKANNTPNELAKFGDFVECMNYTLQMVQQAPISDELIRLTLEELIDSADLECLGSLDIKYDETIAGLTYRQFLGDENGLSKYKSGDESYKQSQINRLRDSDAFNRYVLKNKVLTQIKINPKVLSSDPQNSVSITSTTQGMTGTPYNILSMHQDLIYHEKEGLGTDGVTLDLIRKKKTKVVCVDHYSKIEELLSEVIPSLDNAEDLRALTDVGALFRGQDNLAVAKGHAELVKQKDSLGLDKELNHVLFFDNKTNELYAYDMARDVTIPIKTTETEVIDSKLSSNTSTRFTYYDQARTVGTDLRQAPTAHALVTIDQNTVRNRFLQGVMRMRDLKGDQEITVIAPSYLKHTLNKENVELEDILKLIDDNQDQLQMQLNLRGTLQKYKNAVRADLIEKLLTIDDPDEKAKAAHLFEKFFCVEFTADHYLNYGTITRLQETQPYLEKLEAYFLQQWQAMMKQANLDIQLDNENSLKATLNKITDQGIKACPLKTSQADSKDQSLESSASNFEVNHTHLGQTVEVQTELSSELENELEKQSELELEKELLMIDPQAQPNRSSLFHLSNQEAPVFKGDIGYPLLPFLKAFDDHDSEFNISQDIALSRAFARTHQKQSVYLSATTKPIQSILFVTSKQNPDKAEAIIITTEESKEYANLTQDEIREKYSNKGDVWLVSPSGTLMGGHRPTPLPSNYNEIMEQIRFINGNVKLLAEQYGDYSWLHENTTAKIKYLKEKVLPLWPDQAKYLKSLESRLGVVNAIYRQVLNNSHLDFRYHDWAKDFPEYKHLEVKDKRLIDKLSHGVFDIQQAFIEGVETEDWSKVTSEQWLKQYPDELKALLKFKQTQIIFIQGFFDKLNDAKKFSIMLEEAKQNGHSVEFYDNTGKSLLHQALENSLSEQIGMLLDCSDWHSTHSDLAGKSSTEYIAEYINKHDTLNRELLLKCVCFDLSILVAQPLENNILYCAVKDNQFDKVKDLLDLCLLVDVDYSTLTQLLTEIDDRLKPNESIKSLISNTSATDFLDSKKALDGLANDILQNSKIKDAASFDETEKFLLLNHTLESGRTILEEAFMRKNASAIEMICQLGEFDLRRLYQLDTDPYDVLLCDASHMNSEELSQHKQLIATVLKYSPSDLILPGLLTRHITTPSGTKPFLQFVIHELDIQTIEKLLNLFHGAAYDIIEWPSHILESLPSDKLVELLSLILKSEPPIDKKDIIKCLITFADPMIKAISTSDNPDYLDCLIKFASLSRGYAFGERLYSIFASLCENKLTSVFEQLLAHREITTLDCIEHFQVFLDSDINKKISFIQREAYPASIQDYVSDKTDLSLGLQLLDGILDLRPLVKPEDMQQPPYNLELFREPMHPHMIISSTMPHMMLPGMALGMPSMVAEVPSGMSSNGPIQNQAPIENPNVKIQHDFLQQRKKELAGIVNQQNALNQNILSQLYINKPTRPAIKRYPSKDIMDFMMESGVKLEEPDVFGNTPLHYFALTMQPDVDIPPQFKYKAEIRTLHDLFDLGLDFNIKNNEGHSALDLLLMHQKSTPEIIFEAVILQASKDPGFIKEYPELFELKASGDTTLLHRIAKEGDMFVAKSLFKQANDVNRLDAQGITPLTYALLAHDLPKAHALIEHGAHLNPYQLNHYTLDDAEKEHLIDVYAHKHLVGALYANDLELIKAHMQGPFDPNDCGLLTQASSPLILAIQNNLSDVALDLIDAGAHLDQTDPAGKTVLMLACEKNMEEVVDKLLQSGVDLNHPALFPGAVIESALRSKNIKLAKKLINAGAVLYVNFESSFNDLPQAQQEELKAYFVDSSLNAAIMFKNEEKALEHIRAGCDVNAMDTRSHAPVVYTALEQGMQKTTLALISNDADLSYKDYTNTNLLMMAVRRGQKDVVEALIEKGIDINAKDNMGKTCLSYAIESNQDEIALKLLEKNIDVNQQGPYSPLVLAVKLGNKTLVDALLERRVEGLEEALNSALERNKDEMVKMLIEAGANIEHLYRNQTPLVWAIKNKKVDLTHWLLENGADVRFKFNNDYSTLALACQSKNKDIINALFKHGFTIGVEHSRNYDGIERFTTDPDLKKCILDSFAEHSLLGAILTNNEAKALDHIASSSVEEINQSSNYSLLCQAMDNSSMKVVHALIDKGVDLNKESFGTSPLRKAAAKSNKPLVELLLRKGARINDENGECTAINVAIFNKDQEMAIMLLEKGGVLKTPSLFQKAIKSELTQTVLKLIETGMDIHQPISSRSHETPLDFASPELRQLMIDKYDEVQKQKVQASQGSQNKQPIALAVFSRKKEKILKPMDQPQSKSDVTGTVKLEDAQQAISKLIQDTEELVLNLNKTTSSKPIYMKNSDKDGYKAEVVEKVIEPLEKCLSELKENQKAITKDEIDSYIDKIKQLSSAHEDLCKHHPSPFKSEVETLVHNSLQVVTNMQKQTAKSLRK